MNTTTTYAQFKEEVYEVDNEYRECRPNPTTVKPKVDFSKIKRRKIISTEEALKDASPILWSDQVINGEKHVILGQDGKGNLCLKTGI